MMFYKLTALIRNLALPITLCVINSGCQPYQVSAELSLIELHNQARKKGLNCQSLRKHKAPPLTWNSQLARAAQKHSEDMYTKKYLSHVNHSQQNTGDRISATGYQWRGYAENLASGVYTDAAVFNLWLNSQPHCQNIINATHTEMGAAQVNGYWTAIYAKP